MLPVRDAELVQLVDASLAEASRRAQKADGTSWLACRPGCNACCRGVFRISILDAERLRAAWRELNERDAARADAIKARAQHLATCWAALFPGDPHTGLLVAEDDPAWESFADLEATDVPCPVLDPPTGQCELYQGRPLTCRVFGPPVENEGGLGCCELCYVGAKEDEVLAGEMPLRHTALEDELDRQLPAGDTVIAWALLPE